RNAGEQNRRGGRSCQRAKKLVQWVKRRHVSREVSPIPDDVGPRARRRGCATPSFSLPFGGGVGHDGPNLDLLVIGHWLLLIWKAFARAPVVRVDELAAP